MEKVGTKFRVSDFIGFVVIGYDKNNKYFSKNVKIYYYAKSIAPWRGNMWGVLPSGRRKRLFTYKN